MKDKEAMLKEATRGPKEGTYEMGVAMKKNKAGGTGVEPKTWKRKESPYCNCGAKNPHKNKNSQHCLFIKQKSNDAGPPNDTST